MRRAARAAQARALRAPSTLHTLARPLLPSGGQCFGGPPPPAPAPRADNARAVEEAAWLRRMLEKEQQARAAAEEALSAERLRNALLEREVLAAAQVGAPRRDLALALQ